MTKQQVIGYLEGTIDKCEAGDKQYVIADDLCEVLKDAVEYLKGKAGRWIIDDIDFGRIHKCHCSKCGADPLDIVSGTEERWTYTGKLPHQCPNCGVRMEN